MILMSNHDAHNKFFKELRYRSVLKKTRIAIFIEMSEITDYFDFGVVCLDVRTTI